MGKGAVAGVWPGEQGVAVPPGGGETRLSHPAGTADWRGRSAAAAPQALPKTAQLRPGLACGLDQGRLNMRALELQPKRHQQKGSCRAHQQTRQAASNQPGKNNQQRKHDLNNAEITVELLG